MSRVWKIDKKLNKSRILYAKPGVSIKKIIILATILFGLFVFLGTFSSGSPGIEQVTRLYVDPMENVFFTNTTSVGDTFTINVSVDDVDDLYGFEFKLGYNTTLLDIVSREILPPWELYFIATNEINETNGTYWLIVVALTPAPSFYGNTTLARITFQITMAPPVGGSVSCDLDLYDTTLPNSSAGPIPHVIEDGYYEYVSSAIEPYLDLVPFFYTGSYLGETFDINITINDLDSGWALAGAEFKLGYNSTLLNVTNVTEGPFLSQFVDPPEQGTYFISIVNVTNVTGWGYVHIGNVILSDNGTYYPPYPEGNGTLATITFNITYAPPWLEFASSDLDFYDTILADINSSLIPHYALDGIYIYKPPEEEKEKIINETSGNDIDITYVGVCTENCTKIVFIQVVCRYVELQNGTKISFKPGAMGGSWGTKDADTVDGGKWCTVDYITTESDPYYNGDDSKDHGEQGKHNAVVKNATMSDGPYTSSGTIRRLNTSVANGKLKKVIKEFETCTFCAEGNDKGTYYGCIKWKYERSPGPGDGTVTATSTAAAPSTKFNDAVNKWATNHGFTMPS